MLFLDEETNYNLSDNKMHSLSMLDTKSFNDSETLAYDV